MKRSSYFVSKMAERLAFVPVVGMALCASLMFASTSFAQAARPYIFGRTIDFGLTKVGKTLEGKVFVMNSDSNRGSIHVHATAPTMPEFRLLSADSLVVEPRGYDSIVFAFQPTSAGEFTDSIFLTHDGDQSRYTSPYKITLHGIALAANDTSPTIWVTPASLSLTTSLGTPTSRTLRIINVSDTMRTLRGTISRPAVPFSLQESDSTFSLQTGDTATFTIGFDPTKATLFTDTIHIASNADRYHSDLAIVLSGSAEDSHPSISVSLHYVDFGLVTSGGDSTVNLVLGNTGNSGTLYDTIYPPTTQAFTLLSPAGTSVVPAKHTIPIDIKFSPTAPGEYDDSVVINTNALYDDQHIVILLTGMADGTASVETRSVANGISVSIDGPNLIVLRPGSTNLATVYGLDVRGVRLWTRTMPSERLTIPTAQISPTCRYIEMQERGNVTFVPIQRAQLSTR